MRGRELFLVLLLVITTQLCFFLYYMQYVRELTVCRHREDTLVSITVSQARSDNLKEVVLGMATGYRWHQLRNFVTSLRITGYRGDIVLFLSEEAKWDFALRERLHHYGVEAVFTKPAFPYFENNSVLSRTALSMEPMETIKDMHRRFHLMEIWMKAHGSMYTHALVTDTRDVVFQLDPFDWSGIIQKPPQDKRGNPEPMIIGDKLYAFKEHLGITLATHDINRKWVEGAFGESGLNRIGGEPVICSGTTMGSIKALREYLSRMVDMLRKLLDEYPKAYFNDNIYDQALHNYVLYRWDYYYQGDYHEHLHNDTTKMHNNNHNKGVIIHFFENEESPVLALGAMPPAQIKLDDNAVVVFNKDKSIPPIVHQYDRAGTLLNGWTLIFSYLDTIQSRPYQDYLSALEGAKAVTQ